MKDLHRCQLTARAVALTHNCWYLFVQQAHPKARREALTCFPLLLAGIAEKTRHACQDRLTITPIHAYGEQAKALLLSVSSLLNIWHRTTEQLKQKTVWPCVCDYLIKALTGFNGRIPALSPPNTPDFAPA